VVLCAFQRFEIWEPGRFPSAPRADFILDEPPENYEKLLFLADTDQEPLCGDSYKELTTEAAKVMVELYQALFDAPPQTVLRQHSWSRRRWVRTRWRHGHFGRQVRPQSTRDAPLGLFFRWSC